MAGSRKRHPCYLIAFVAVLSLSSVWVQVDATDTTTTDYQEAAKNEYLSWIGRMVAQHQASSEIYGPTTVDSFARSNTIVITVNPKKGKGDFRKVHKAIDSIPDHSSDRYVILVAPGTYKEKVTITSKKGPITLIGAGMRKTKITYHLDSAKAGGTMASASVSVLSDNFICKDIAFENSSPSPPPGAVGKQAVAFMIKGDKGAFYRVAFLGYQDTLYDKLGRHYFKDCYIRGTIDFIFGDGTSYYETSRLDSVTDSFGSLTAQKRATTTERSGFSFVNCKVTGNGYSFLGRAWGAASRAVFVRNYFSAAIRPEGWYDWGISSREKTVFYGEYKCYGPGSNRKGRERWSLELTHAQVKPFLTIDWIQGKTWLPKGPQ